MPFYEQSRAELKEMLTKRREMAKKLVSFCLLLLYELSHGTTPPPQQPPRA